MSDTSTVPDLRTIRMALAIADESARRDVVMYSMRRWPDANTGCWYSTAPSEVAARAVAGALEYLDARGLLIRHPQYPEYVRVRST